MEFNIEIETRPSWTYRIAIAVAVFIGVSIIGGFLWGLVHVAQAATLSRNCNEDCYPIQGRVRDGECSCAERNDR